MSNIQDIKEILVALQLNGKFKYDLVQEWKWSPKRKNIYCTYSVIKWHKEIIYNEELQANKATKVLNDRVKGKAEEILQYLVEELKGIDST